MRRSALAWWRLAKQVLLGESADPSAATSTFTNGTWGVTANGATTATLTLTVRDVDGNVLPSRPITFEVERTFVSAAQCTLDTDAAEIETTTGTANITAYILNADGTPLPGIPAASLTLASTGSGNTITAVDSVTDRNGRFRWTFSSTSAATKTLSLTACGLAITDTAQVIVGTVGLQTPVFYSDWSTATGTGTSAKGDGGKWNTIADSANGLEVVASTGLGFPASMVNVLKVTAMEANAGTQRLQASGLGVPGAGDTRAVRFYLRLEQTDTSDVTNHPIESGQTGGLDWVFQTRVVTSTTWSPLFTSSGDNGTWRQAWLGTFTLSHGTVYRFNILLTLLTSATFTAKMRVYDVDGTLLYDESDFLNEFGTGGHVPGDTSMADETTLTFSGSDADMLDQIRAGLNGLSGSTWFPSHLYGYQGGMAVVDNDGWVSAYGGVSGEP